MGGKRSNEQAQSNLEARRSKTLSAAEIERIGKAG